MHRAVGLIVAVACAGMGCGETPLTQDELVSRLRTLPGVTVEPGEFPAGSTELAKTYQYYILNFTQPVDHNDPSRGTFQQQVRLLHANELAPNPMIVYTTGYADSWGYKPAEITRLLAGNQVSIEHRYFGASRPEVVDWSRLTIAQMAADEHEIIVALRSIYDGAFISTGGSKGGMTAVYHRRFYPDDVDGTVAYVTPLSRSESDGAYQLALDALSMTGCRDAVRKAAINMLANHREEIVARARDQSEHDYKRVKIEAAVEAAIASIEWSFWQYKGASECDTVPAQTATVDELFAFLEEVSSVADYDDQNVAAFEAYVYQSHTQLGYPSEAPSYLADQGLLQFGPMDYAGKLPYDDDEHEDKDGKQPVPGRGPSHRLAPLAVTFDRQAMTDIADFVEQRGDRLLFIYGGADPWSARRFSLGTATRSAMFTQQDGNHRAQIWSLGAEDRSAAYAMLEDWTGVEPQPNRMRSPGASGELGASIDGGPDEWPRRRAPGRAPALRAGK